MSTTRLNLGSGRDILPSEDGWINLDITPLYGADLIHDLSKPLPFPDDSIEEIKAFDILEHIPPWKRSRVEILNDFHRVLKPGGILRVRTPHAEGPGWYQDPTHVTLPWGRELWDYFTGEHGPEHMVGYGITAQFDLNQWVNDSLNIELLLFAVKPTIQEKWMQENLGSRSQDPKP